MMRHRSIHPIVFVGAGGMMVAEVCVCTDEEQMLLHIQPEMRAECHAHGGPVAWTYPRVCQCERLYAAKPHLSPWSRRRRCVAALSTGRASSDARSIKVRVT
jgi:hypothetical protein